MKKGGILFVPPKQWRENSRLQRLTGVKCSTFSTFHAMLEIINQAKLTGGKGCPSKLSNADKNTVKKIICVTVSNGRKHDFKIYKESGVVLSPTITAMADRDCRKHMVIQLFRKKVQRKGRLAKKEKSTIVRWVHKR